MAHNNYFFFSPTGNATQNMAYDDFFLSKLGKDDFLMMFYVNDNAVIIGKNQNGWRECNLPTMEADNVTLARRVSGGGAVYHDKGNLNFSFIAGENRYDVQAQLKLIVDTMQNMGIPAAFSGRNDILADGKKFSGNAFCRRGMINMHHGTILVDTDLSRLQNYLNVSQKKIESKGITSVRSRVCNISEFNKDLTVDTVAQTLEEVYYTTYDLPSIFIFSEEDKQALATLQEKHASWDWRLGSAPQFDIALEERFVWGGIEFYLSVKHGKVTNATVYSDALDPTLAEQLTPALLGAQFTSESLAAQVKGIVGFSTEKQEIADFLLAQAL